MGRKEEERYKGKEGRESRNGRRQGWGCKESHLKDMQLSRKYSPASYHMRVYQETQEVKHLSLSNSTHIYNFNRELASTWDKRSVDYIIQRPRGQGDRGEAGSEHGPTLK